MHRLLKRHKLSRRVPVQKPVLTQLAREKRLRWAELYGGWELWKWKRVVFSDEKIFRGDSCRKSLRVTRLNHEKFHPSCIQPTVKHPPQVHVWGTVGWMGLGPLKRIQGNLNSQAYQGQVINDLRETGESLVPPRAKMIFQQDHAPAHHSRSTREYLAANGIEVLDWPGNSPDLNVIENVWAMVVQKMRGDRSLPKSSDELWARVLRAWDSIPLRDVRKLFHTIPCRVQEVLENEGGPTHY